jgi:hypothetical protein
MMCETIEVSKNDLLKVRSVLENLRVSLHQIGSTHALDCQKTNMPADHMSQRAQTRCQLELEALGAYFTPELYRQIAEAWRIISEYIPDEDTEALVEQEIPYWELKPQAGSTI